MTRHYKLTVAFLGLFLSAFFSAYAKDKSAAYQMGTFFSGTTAADGTTTSKVGVSSGVFADTVTSRVTENRLKVYSLTTATGGWGLTPYDEAADSKLRGMGMNPIHLKSEHANPLDFLKNGDPVLFRVERHKKLLGTETDVYVPFADNPNKEFKFVGTFAPAAGFTGPTNNVQAMCQAGKLSAELQKQYCSQ
jgi:hypothetical protein